MIFNMVFSTQITLTCQVNLTFSSAGFKGTEWIQMFPAVKVPLIIKWKQSGKGRITHLPCHTALTEVELETVLMNLTIWILISSAF